MENTPVKLRLPRPDWHGFEDNQVLTADLLNDTVRYLDAQTRLSRVYLTGVGVVFGLHPVLNDGSLHLSRGFGLTTDGDLLGFAENGSFGKIAPFPDSRGEYAAFRSGGTMVTLWELLPADSPRPDATPLTDLLAAHPDNDLVALLYAEQFLEKHEICRADRCDAAGQTVHSEPRALLLTRADADSLLRRSGERRLPDLPPLAVRRPKFSERITQFEQLAEVYHAASTQTLADVKTALTAADPILKTLFDLAQETAGMPFEGLPAVDGAALAERLAQAVNAVRRTHAVQYAHDALRDVAAVYQEFRETVNDLGLSALPSPELFPKHLLLGSLPTSGPDDVYRTTFRPSVAQAGRAERLRAALRQYRRLQTLVETFAPNAAPRQLTVTPSAGPGAPLGERALPVYYDAARLATAWPGERRGPGQVLLSCHASQFTDQPEALNPLDYDWPQADFYRVEGHLNRPFREIQAELTRLREQQDLPFDLVGVQIEENPGTLLWPPRFHFPVTDLVLRTQQAQFNGHLSQVKTFADQLDEGVKTAAESPEFGSVAGEFGDAAALSQRRQSVQALKISLNEQADAIQTAFDNPAATSVQPLHAALSDKAAELNLKARPFVNATAATLTPLDTLAVQVQPHLIDWLRDHRTEQETAAKSAYFFTNFLRKHPALLHAGGVPIGGTFVLVYNGSGTVVADFYLPHAWVEVPAETPPPKPLPLPKVTLPLDYKPWLLNADRFRPELNLRKNVLELDKRMVTADLLEGKLAQSARDLKTDVTNQIGQVNALVDAKVLTQDAKIAGVSGQVQTVGAQVQGQMKTFADSNLKLTDSYAAFFNRTKADVGTVKDLGNGIRTVLSEDNRTFIALEPAEFEKLNQLVSNVATVKPNTVLPQDVAVLQTNATKINDAIKQDPNRFNIFRINR